MGTVCAVVSNLHVLAYDSCHSNLMVVVYYAEAVFALTFVMNGSFRLTFLNKIVCIIKPQRRHVDCNIIHVTTTWHKREAWWRLYMRGQVALSIVARTIARRHYIPVHTTILSVPVVFSFCTDHGDGMKKVWVIESNFSNSNRGLPHPPTYESCSN